MLKRILIIAAGVCLGMVLSLGAVRMAAAWGFWPNRDLEKSSAYVREVLKIVNENYVVAKDAAYPRLTQAALRGVLGSLDPHSEYMDAKDYKALSEEISSEFGGIGVQVELRDGHVVVIAPIAGTPGARAGIRRGDQIVSVEGQKIEKPAIDDVVGRLRGKPGTKVTLTYYRPETDKESTVTLVREKIKVDSVRGVRLLPGGVGYLQLTQFSERTGDEFINALNKLNDEGMRALVIDLRDNPGGLLDAAVQVAEPFFNKGELIVYTQGRRPEDRDEYRAAAPEPPLAIPVAVLINSGTASAAEIVSGALKDTHRAVIVGERSFGKGSVQTIIDLHNGDGMRLTTARYYTPSGITIHEHGVSPDVEVVMTAAEDQNIRLQNTRDDVTTAAEFKEEFDVEALPDRQLNAALAVMKAALVLEDAKPASATKP
ncbi:MAG TPA: S41 family peptidase [Rariglobus sp.]|nr:S41 family peptidase [Rariglobus sp.]